MPVATVIIPCGPRHVHLLQRAIDSARAQTVPVDVRWFVDEERKGPGYGRNLLAKTVATPFLITLDADDYLLPTFVERTLDAWMRCKPKGYIYTDWYQGERHVKAATCYGVFRQPDEAPFHLPPTLFPTALYHALGGYDETLFGAEDTEFYWRANAMGVHNLHLREPLFHYTPDGFRAKESSQDPRWMDLLIQVSETVKGKLSMARCGDCGRGDTGPVNANERQADDILARPRGQEMIRRFGSVTGTAYGRISAKHTVYVRKADFNEQQWERVVDVESTLPSKEEIEAASKKAPESGQQTTVDLAKFDRSDPVQMEAAIRQVGVREWRADSNHIRHGFDIQQTPSELAELLVEAHKRGVKRVIEIGTGESAGLARFMVEVLDWEVVSIDKVKPKTDLFNDRRWAFIEGESQTVELPKDLKADMIVIDGDHSFKATEADWKRYSDMAPLVVLHDISPDGWWGGDDKTGGFWRSIAKGPKGGMKKGFREIIAPLDTVNQMAVEGRQGIGVYVNE